MIEDIKSSPKGNKPSEKSNTKTKTPVPSPVADVFKRGISFIDANVMPVAAWAAIVGLAVRGAMTLLAHMSPNIQLTIAICIVAFLAFKLK